jgi:hypothetical protein
VSRVIIPEIDLLGFGIIESQETLPETSIIPYRHQIGGRDGCGRLGCEGKVLPLTDLFGRSLLRLLSEVAL